MGTSTSLGRLTSHLRPLRRGLPACAWSDDALHDPAVLLQAGRLLSGNRPHTAARRGSKVCCMGLGKTLRHRRASTSDRQSMDKTAADCQEYLPASSICRSHLLLDLHVCRAEVHIRTHWGRGFQH